MRGRVSLCQELKCMSAYDAPSTSIMEAGMKDFLRKGHWSEYLVGFSERNRERRARFEVFDREGAHEEIEEAFLENILLEPHLEGDPDIVVKRSDRSDGQRKFVANTIVGVHRISPQYDQDGSESALEFEDERGRLTILRFESNIDGAS